MTYIKVRWHHSDPTEPTILYSELDESRWEVRKVELYADGSCGYAGEGEACGGTMLGAVVIPLLDQIAADRQFEAVETSKAEFEAVWKDREKHLRSGEELA